MTRRHDPSPVTITDELLAQVRDELRTLNAHFGGAEPSGPAVADGLTVTEQPAEPEPVRTEGNYGAVIDDGPYSCRDCPRSFTTQSGLSRHRQAKHEEG